jgi:uncharacterized membrane protein
MFEFLFHYPLSVFRKGQIVFASGWPLWLLLLLIVLAAAALFWYQRRSVAAGRRSMTLWALQSLAAAVALWTLWQPAIRVTTLRQRENLIAVIADTSASMNRNDGEGRRVDQAQGVLKNGLLDSLNRRYATRLYAMGADAARLPKLEGLNAVQPMTRIGDAISSVLNDANGMPLGAIVLLSDGADNSGGVSLETMNELRRRRIPVHTIGFGATQAKKDVELVHVQSPALALPDKRVAVQVSLRQQGMEGQTARLFVRADGKVVASTETKLRADGKAQVESLLFQSGPAGFRTLTIGVLPLDGEEVAANNQLTRVMKVDGLKRRVLYIEGEPRWEYKFLRRALESDPAIELVSVVRTTQNKFYRQGVSGADDLADGFPTKEEDLFAYHAIVIGSVEASWFPAPWQELLKQFVDRRGGSILMLAGRSSLADGGWASSAMNELLPVQLPGGKNTFSRDTAQLELTAAGREHLALRLEEDATKNVERWKKMPALANYQTPGTPRPAAVVLAEAVNARGRTPLLVSHQYGRGRVALLATSGTWRWQMLQPLEDKTHEIFWQQMLSWLSVDSQQPVHVEPLRSVLTDETRTTLRAEIRDKKFQPVNDAAVLARLLAPNGQATEVAMEADLARPGLYSAAISAPQAGSWVSEVSAKRAEADAGADSTSLLREDGIAESFQPWQNKLLLERLSTATGGTYSTPATANRLQEEIALSEAGVTVNEMKGLHDMPLVFVILFGLKAAEWLLRRRWGTI